MNAEQRQAVAALESFAANPIDHELTSEKAETILKAVREMGELERIAYISYHKVSGNVTQVERDELSELLRAWKRKFDQAAISQSGVKEEGEEI